MDLKSLSLNSGVQGRIVGQDRQPPRHIHGRAADREDRVYRWPVDASCLNSRAPGRWSGTTPRKVHVMKRDQSFECDGTSTDLRGPQCTTRHGWHGADRR